MGVKFFGQFLLSEKVVTRDQLNEAIELQRSNNMPLGQYAVKLGFLTDSRANEINFKQQREPGHFGAIAVSLGFLTSEQLDRLLSMQAKEHVRIGEALVMCGHVTEKTLQPLLDKFVEDQKRYTTSLQLPDTLPMRQEAAELVEMTQSMLLRVSRIKAKLGGFSTKLQAPDPEMHTVSVQMAGAVSFDFLLSYTNWFAIEFSRTLLDDPFPNEETLIDALKEFGNLVCGNAAAKLSNAGRSLELGPPMYPANEFTKDAEGLHVALATTEGDIELRMITKVRL